MFGATSRKAERVTEGAVAPVTGLLGLLAAPVPQDDALLTALEPLDSTSLPGLLERLAFHRLEGLAHRALSRLPQEAVDPWLRSTLKRRSQRFAAATLAQGLALADILDVFDRDAIPVVVMRGLHAVETIYGGPSLRPFEDHDLLILPEDRAPACAALRRTGFTEEAEGLFRRGGVIVDLHTDPLGARRRPSRDRVFPLPVRDLFDRAVRDRVAGAPALWLVPEDDLLLLAIHLVKHSFDRLIRVADVAHFVFRRRGELDWRVLERRAEASGTARILGWALEAASILGVTVRAAHHPAPVEAGTVERMLMTRVCRLRPLPYTGEFLMTLAAPTVLARVLFLLDALWPRGERPNGVLRRSAALPRRVYQLAQGGAREIAARRRIR